MESVCGESPDPDEDTPPLIRSLGGELEGHYFVVGENEIKAISTMPDDVALEPAAAAA